ncbi:MAG: hypothetical protein RL199_1893 [Pseudomonadota bacterium]|jgi:hypothetical protein
MTLWKLLHVASVGLFFGAQAVMFALHRRAMAAGGSNRRALAETNAWAARVVVMPVMYLAYFSGLGYFAANLELFKSAPYVHDMLLWATFAVGFAQMWKARARKAALALSEGDEAGAAAHFAKGRFFVIAGLVLSFLAYVSAISKASFHP